MDEATSRRNATLATAIKINEETIRLSKSRKVVETAKVRLAELIAIRDAR